MDNEREALDPIDAAIAEKLCAVPVPAGLRERILAQRAVPTEVPVPRFWVKRRIYAAATLGVLLLLVALIQPPAHGVPFALYEHDLADQIACGEVNQLAYTSAETTALKDWLVHHGAPSAIHIPAGADRLPGVGCRTFVWNGRHVSQICFALENGKIVHLFVIEKMPWRGAPPEGHPQFSSHGDWTLASWREAGATYILAREGDRADLEKLFL